MSPTTVTEYDIATEAALKGSGLAYTILFNALYLDAVPMILGETLPLDGVRLPGGDGKGTMVSRRDLAEANAVVLTQSGHVNTSYTLGASEAASFADIAAKVGVGLPEPVAAFLVEWVQAVATGEYAEVTQDLERLLGRHPTTCAAFLEARYSRAA